MADSPTTRTLKALRDSGWMAGVVEYWQPSHASRAVVDEAVKIAGGGSPAGLRSAVATLKRYGPGKRQDLFGFVDIIAVGRGYPLFIQCTSYENISARCTKIIVECNYQAVACLRSRCQIQVWGWKRWPKAVKRKYWRPSIRSLKLSVNGGISVEKSQGYEPEETPDDLPF